MIWRFGKMILGGVAMGMIMLGVGGAPVRAEEGPVVRMLISPLDIDYGTLKPGEEFSGEFAVENTGDVEYTVELRTQPYSVKADGELDFGGRNEHTEIMDWVEFVEPSKVLMPGEKFKVNFTVKVPKDAPSGAQGTRIIAQATRGKQELQTTGVVFNSQVGLLLIGNIDGGDTRMAAEVVKTGASFWVFEGPMRATATVKNSGNVFVDVKQVLEVRTLFGGELVATNELDGINNHFAAYPGAEVTHEVMWDTPPQLGVFKLRQIVEVLGERREMEKIVIVCPVWFLMMAIAFVVLLVWMIVGRVRTAKKLKSRADVI